MRSSRESSEIPKLAVSFEKIKIRYMTYYYSYCSVLDFGPWHDGRVSLLLYDTTSCLHKGIITQVCTVIILV